MGGCCATRQSAKFDTGMHEALVTQLNRLPSLENFTNLYEELDLPPIPKMKKLHAKEKIFLMIINLL